MKKLNRMLLREIKRSGGQFIAIIIVIAIGVMMYTGINSTFENLQNTRDKYYESHNFEHIEITGYNIPSVMEEKLLEIPGVEMATARIILNARLQAGSDNPELRVLSLPDIRADIVNNISIIDGKLLDDGCLNECILEKTFADGNGFKVGDVITPDINEKKVSLKVAGICKSPEYVYVIKSPQDFMPDAKKFGVMYISKSLSENLLGTTEYCNNIAVLLKSGYSVEDVKPDIEKLLKDYEGIKLTDRKDQLSNLMLDEEMVGLKATGIAVPIVFFIVASVIIYIMMGRIIENKRIYIGILKSLGYKNSQILTHYMAYPIITGTVGSILGTILGYFLGMVFTGIENQYFGFPVLHYSFYSNLILPAVALTFLFCIFSAYTACKSVFKISPSESMKPPAPKNGKRIMLEKIPFIWSKLKFTQKMKFRSISRNRRRNFLTSIGIILSTAVLVVGFSISNSLNYVLKQTFDVEQRFDMKVTFKTPAGISELEQIRLISNISHVEPIFEGAAEVKNNTHKKNVTISAIPGYSSLYRVLDSKGQARHLPDKGILVPERLLQSLDAKVGDYIDIKAYFPGARSTKIKISGISEQYLGLGVAMDIKNLASVLGNDNLCTGAVLKLDSSSPADVRKVKDDLNKLPIVNSVEFRLDARSNMVKNLEPFSLFSAATILLAAVMSIAVIYNITVINIFEKKRELSSLKVMGFTKKEIRSSVYDENLAVGALSLIIGLPLGRLFVKYILKHFYTADAYAFPVVTYISTYAYTVILVFIFILLAQVLLRRKIDRIDMVDVLKVRE